MKFVITKSRSAFEYYRRRRQYIDGGGEYRYLIDPGQVRGHKEINVVLFDGFEEKEEILDFLEHYRGYNQVYYELGSEI